jgi:predicted RNA binding protein YcfA (HicA-like mRNA interferase family)
MAKLKSSSRQTIDEYITELLQRRRSTRFKDLARILFESGFTIRQQKRGGSHVVFKHPLVNVLVVLVTHGKNDTV